ncbi:phosphoribosyl-dephospho-CoA transferase [Burkholderia sp. YR290]|jgi:phosphoribosyl-dephospho-CoA transferase|uniref:malonate decarboxylase holo-ACP synthase n=1 Tax=Paraburkholderia hospita TaxID=169430 RepID=UPI0009A6646F|nr:malonate decarboxylase holo-ACP synthase [Paraburkholderia hospita]SKC90960.1 phosphoribosyl-dephospho-CoA transferase [Paraburkholderia hospita]SOE86498.1 phosphoribosyl-dephospho-CoA transferase [Burkholderia sp. YR290]
MRVCAAAPFAPEDALVADDLRWQAHDIVLLQRLESFDNEPAWVRAAFARAPFAVVRRAQAAAGLIAVGLRGAARNERYGTWARSDDIEAVFRPEALLSPPCVLAADRAGLPVFVALDALRRNTSCIDSFIWGPTGSVGFELASGKPTATATSDLDLLIRMPNHLPRDEAQRIQAKLDEQAARAGIRIDAQLETPAGGVALAEYASGKARVMARHASGPRLVVDPWAL